MKKNLAKQITLGIVIGTMLMGSSAAYAENIISEAYVPRGSIPTGITALAAGDAFAGANGSIVIGVGDGTGASDYDTTALATSAFSIVIGADSETSDEFNVIIGANNNVGGKHNVVIGDHITNSAAYGGSKNVILGYGSSAAGSYGNPVVSVGSGVEAAANDPDPAPQYRRIINVADGSADHDAATVGQMKTYVDDALANVSGGGNVDLSGYYTKDEADAAFIKATKNGSDSVISSSIVIDTGNTSNTIEFDGDGITVGDNSTHMDEAGFYASDNGVHTYDGANAAMMKDGRIKGAGGAFAVDASGNVTANNLYTKDQVDTALGAKANVADVYTKTEADSLLGDKADKATTLSGYGITDAYTKTDIDTMLGGSTQDISALESRADTMQQDLSDLNAEVVKTNDHFNAELQKTNDHFNTELGKTNQQVVANARGIAANSQAIEGLGQRLDRTDAKIDKVGAGAAALASLHPLDYDPDNKLQFSAGVGRYEGETAAAVGAFYHADENVMVSLGGTVGNGANMVNLGLSFAVGKGSSGLAKMSKLELIDKVQQVEAENKEVRNEINNVKAENQNLKEELAEMKVMLQELAAKF